MNPRMQMRQRGMLHFWIAVGVAILMLILYTLIYLIGPFSDFWNTFASNVFTVLSAGLSATFGTLVWRAYESDDAPRRVWRWYAVALWLWTIAEIVWGYLNVSSGGGAVPVGLPDVFWVVAHGFFG